MPCRKTKTMKYDEFEKNRIHQFLISVNNTPSTDIIVKTKARHIPIIVMVDAPTGAPAPNNPEITALNTPTATLHRAAPAMRFQSAAPPAPRVTTVPIRSGTIAANPQMAFKPGRAPDLSIYSQSAMTKIAVPAIAHRIICQ